MTGNPVSRAYDRSAARETPRTGRETIPSPSRRSCGIPPQTPRPRAAQQVQQDGLDMVVLRVSGAEDVARRENAFERLVSRGTCGPFVTARGVARPHVGVVHGEPDGQPLTDIPAMVRPPRRIIVQVVVDVHGVHAVQVRGVSADRCPRESMEQCQRVRPATERDDESGPGREPGHEFRDGPGSERLSATSIHDATAEPGQRAYPSASTVTPMLSDAKNTYRRLSPPGFTAPWTWRRRRRLRAGRPASRIPRARCSRP